MDTQVIVLGAGAAGLSAARTLLDAGREVVVLEAREGPGGRIRTEHVPGLDTAVELGAEFVHGRAPSTRKWLAAAGSRVERMVQRHHVADEGGPDPAEERWRALGTVMAQLAPAGADTSVAEALARIDVEPEVLELARGYLTGFHALDPERASARAIGEEEAASGGGAERTIRIPDGQDRILHGLLVRGSRPDIRTRTVVEHVAYGGDRVVVHARGPLGPVRLVGSRVVVALPIGVLQAGSVVFDPPLTLPIDSVAPGAIVRVVLRFDRPFWEDETKRMSFLFGPGRFRTFWPVARAAPAIVAWCGGPVARELSTRTERERVERAVADFAAALDRPENDVVDHLRGWHHHDWVNDPFARGAYSYVATGGVDAQAALAEPQGRLVLAGEHVATKGTVSSTVEAALRSGDRAAKRLLKGS